MNLYVRVWADMALNLGAYAEMVKVKESNLGIAPSTISMGESATLPLVSMTSLAALKATEAPWTDTYPKSTLLLAEPQTSGPVVLVLGASGGCGSAGARLTLTLCVILN